MTTEHDLMLDSDSLGFDLDDPQDYREADEWYEAMLDKDFVEEMYNHDLIAADAVSEWELERETYAEQ